MSRARIVIISRVWGLLYVRVGDHYERWKWKLFFKNFLGLHYPPKIASLPPGGNLPPGWEPLVYYNNNDIITSPADCVLSVTSPAATPAWKAVMNINEGTSEFRMPGRALVRFSERHVTWFEPIASTHFTMSYNKSKLWTWRVPWYMRLYTHDSWLCEIETHWVAVAGPFQWESTVTTGISTGIVPAVACLCRQCSNVLYPVLPAKTAALEISVWHTNTQGLTASVK